MNINRIIIVLLVGSLISCSSHQPDNIGISNNKLSPCPTSPNCVSSDNRVGKNKIAALILLKTDKSKWQEIKSILSQQAGVKIITSTEDYIHAEFKTAFFGFIDDLELHYRPDDGIIAVRSASRLGYSDFSVNRDRVNELRALLVKHKVSVDTSL